MCGIIIPELRERTETVANVPELGKGESAYDSTNYQELFFQKNKLDYCTLIPGLDFFHKIGYHILVERQKYKKLK